MKKLALCALSLMVATTTQAADVKLFTEEYAPYNYMEGNTLTGHGTEIVKEAVKRAGLSAEYELTSWNRAIVLTEKSADTCLFTTVRSPEREGRFLWAGPMYSEPIYLIQRAGTNGEVSSLEEALTKVIGTQAGDFSEALLDRLGAEQLDMAPSPALTLKKLRAGRVDYMVVLSSAAEAAVAQGGVEIAMELSRNEFYLACSQTTQAEIVAKLDAAIDTIMEDGTQAAIIAKYD